MSNLDVDVPFDQEGYGDINCKKEDSQDLPIRLSSQVSRNFGGSQGSDREEAEMESSPNFNREEDNTAVGHSTKDSRALHHGATDNRLGLGRDAMEIADELGID